MRVEHWVYTVPLRLRSLFRRRAVERELQEELEHHIELQTRENIARGMAPIAARRAARLAMGGTERRKDECRDARRTDRLESVVRDLRFAIRSLRHSPGFTAVAVLTLTLGIAANAAIFTVVNGVLLRPLPYERPDRLVHVRHETMETVAPANFLDWRAAATSFEALGAAQLWGPALSRGDGDRPEELQALQVTPDLLALLGVRPALGRVFRADENEAGREHVVVLSDPLWRTRFGSDSGIVGRRITLDGATYTVVGVMPPGFRFVPFWAPNAQLAVPFVFGNRRTDRGGASMRVIGRLKPGVTLTSAQRELATIGTRLERQYPGTNPGVVATPLQERVVGDVRPALLTLMGAVALVLLIACANVAHLQLMRAAARERELAVRTALGASRSRLVQQSLVESAMLAVAGAVLGTLLAIAGVDLLVRLAPARLPRLDAIAVDGHVLGFVLGLTALAIVAFGIAPALAASQARVMGALRDGARGASDGVRRARARGTLVVSEIALALVLLVGAGLLLRSFVALTRVDPGFDPRGVVSMQVSMRGTDRVAGSERRHVFFDEVLQRVRALPGVESASAINHLPLHGDAWNFPFHVEGRPLEKPGAEPRAVFRIARPGYFSTMRIPVVQGRDLTPDDAAQGARVVVIDAVMARRHWPDENPIGKRLTTDDAARDPQWYTVVGVVKDPKQDRWDEPAREEMYFPYTPIRAGADSAPRGLVTMLSPASMTLVVRGVGGAVPAGLVPSIDRELRALDRQVVISDVITMEDAVGEQFASARFYLLLLGAFAAVALALAAIGIYGVISYATARRTHEIGVRIALGASRTEAFAMVVRGGMRLAGIGLGIGVVVSLVATRFIASMLYGVGATDAATFAGVAAVLAVVALVACGVPGWRASRIEPVRALRGE